MKKTGSCLCGAVTFTLDNVPEKTGACHCSMCRKVSGGVYLGLEVPTENVIFHTDKGLSCYASSEWAERGFCGTCGSSLFYRVTAPGPHHGVYHFGFGSLDDPSGIALTDEIFIDRKPDGYSFAQETRKMKEAEVLAMFAMPDG